MRTARVHPCARPLPPRRRPRVAATPLYPPGPSTGDGDTIAALATADAPAAVAVVRVSGPAALATAAAVFRPAGGAAWPAASHTVAYGHAVDAGGAVIDEVLALAFRAPRSYTREDVVELHTHGGGVCAARVLAALAAAGARAARPGEFTLRAFLGGRLSLDQAEAVADLVSARTRGAADAALAGLGGGVGARVAAIRADALALLARVEAALDFDEGDVPDTTGDDAVQFLTPLRAAIADALATADRGALLRRGATAALVGAPNVGKSSLLNALAGGDRAIVAAEAGTTRDVVTADADVDGLAVTVCDTAGVRDAPSAVEAAGVQRAGAAAAAADVVVVVFDAARGWTADDDAALSVVADAVTAGGGGARAAAARPPRAVLVANKTDAVQKLNAAHREQLPAPPPGLLGTAGPAFDATVSVSAATGAGLDALRTTLATVLNAATSPDAGGTAAAAVNARQADALARAAAGLARAEGDARAGAPSDLWSGGVRDAVLALGEVTGTDAREEVLDAVFSKFCIGK